MAMCSEHDEQASVAMLGATHHLEPVRHDRSRSDKKVDEISLWRTR